MTWENYFLNLVICAYNVSYKSCCTGSALVFMWWWSIQRYYYISQSSRERMYDGVCSRFITDMWRHMEIVNLPYRWDLSEWSVNLSECTDVHVLRQESERLCLIGVSQIRSWCFFSYILYLSPSVEGDYSNGNRPSFRPSRTNFRMITCERKVGLR